MTSKDDEIGGLWNDKTKDGRLYIKGKINGEQVVLFQNEYKKEGERTPDWRVYKSQPREQQANQQPTPQPAPRAAELPAYAPHNAEDDLAF